MPFSKEAQAINASVSQGIRAAQADAFAKRRWLLCADAHGTIAWYDVHGNTRPFTSHNDPEATEPALPSTR